MNNHLGLTPDEMISVFNRMYLEVWEKTKDNINWDLAKISKQMEDEGKEVDISRLLLEVLEVVITATRDGFVVAMYENNERIYNEMRMAYEQQLADMDEEYVDEYGEPIPDDEMMDMEPLNDLGEMDPHAR